MPLIFGARSRTRSPRGPVGRKGSLRGLLALTLTGAALAVPATTAPAAQGDTLYVAWSSVLPGWTDEYIPTSENDCVAGRPSCLDKTLKELHRVFEANAKSCSHLAIFSFAYLRITQTYGWSRDIPGYYEDVPFANHQDAVFAKYFTDAYNNWASGNRADVPQSWLVAFDAGRDKRVTATGDLMLGMNAHINRDLPFVLAAVGLVAPDGSSRKRDYDQVEDFLALASEPMLAEAAQRFDPTADDSSEPTGTAYGTVMAVISAWREQAWRNAEALVSARTPEERAQVAAGIETWANNVAQGILATNSYLPPLTSTTARDSYCAVHKNDGAPMAYPFGTPTPYGY